MRNGDRMILAIDVGNTNTVLGVYKENERIIDWRISTDNDKTSDEYGILLKNLFAHENLKPQKVEEIIISSVVPPVVSVLEKTAARFFGLKPMVVGPGIKTGLNIEVDNPREVGADRIVNAVAALQKYEPPMIIIDFGTATTLCAISEKGSYLGGSIAPGINISIEALFDYAAKLPRVELKDPPSPIGKNTVESMQSGIIYGVVGQVEGLIERFQQKLGDNCPVIATGGLVNKVASRTQKIDKVEPYLTLEGLYYLSKLNQQER